MTKLRALTFRASVFPALLALLLALLPLAVAQTDAQSDTLSGTLAGTLADMLPAETIFALGTNGLEDHADLLEDFVTEFEERDVGEAVRRIFFTDVGTEPADMQVPEPFTNLGLLDLIGRDAWIAVSASAFNPLPVVTLVAHTSDAATSAFAQAMGEASGREGVQELSEGGIPFWVMPLEAPDSPVQVAAFAQQGNVTVLSTNPDTLRGVLRRMAGSGEPGFTTALAYDVTLAQLGGGTDGGLGDGQFFGFLDLGAVATVAAPFTRGLGFAPLVERVQRALATAGSSAGMVRLTDDGIVSHSIMTPNPNGGDLGLYNLLTTPGTYDPNTLRYLPATGLSFTSASTDLTGWWNWLNDLIGAVPELGVQNLDQALRDMAGLDLRATFFDWTGGHLATVTTGVSDVAQPGMSATNLLGEQVYAIQSIDDPAARIGLSTLFTNIASTVASFADPSGGAGGAAVTEQTMHGVTVNVYTITAGVELATTVTDGYALIATSPRALETVLGSAAAGVELSPVFANLVDELPSEAKSIGLSDSRALTEASALQFASLIELGAGFGGSADLDFDAVTRASEAVEGYLLFVASRLGGSVSHSEVVDQTVRTEGRTAVSW